MSDALSKRQILTHPVYLMAFGFGSGLAPKAPGTFGTLVAVPLFWWLADFHWAVLVSCIIVMTAVGVFLCGETARALHKHDHPGIVWDEIVGYLIAMLPLAKDWRAVVIGFILFRFFDIVKPFPIGLADRHVKGGLGIMLDDIIAGLMAALVGGLLWYYASFYQLL
ncbi:phosphatidylglycerophosphatase A family protein [Pleionea litopenaei]|uniref:Phosphatidylglycerophosphatase A n=1 Tax=Pleionea litopenaei TaxID=3070815 RepID=A0AA51RSF3_9GAMM|nr:phosphatidylglycerophosphatase A [Pleionea sp. HL-JVS1]WMS86675.1 phosphatidylglycerophosphatase A [Pleionea sp. HL-JVS1]